MCMMPAAEETRCYAVSQSLWNPIVPPKEATDGQLVSTLVLYLYVLFQASNFISDGSEHLLLVPSLAPIVGSIVLPILGAVPDGMMVLFSGLGENAQEEVSVGVGALAGSTIMLLTLPWFVAVLRGRVNFDHGTPRYRRPAGAGDDWQKLSPPGNLSLFGTGVGFGHEIQDATKYMVVTMVGYLIIQGPAFYIDSSKAGDTLAELQSARARESSAENSWAVAGLLVCTVGFVAYMQKMWQESQKQDGTMLSNIADMQVDAMHSGKLTLRGALASFKDSHWLRVDNVDDLNQALLDADTVEEVRRMCKILAPFFAHYDTNGDHLIDFGEFRMIFNDVHESVPKDVQRQMFDNADIDKKGSICFEEFVACFMSFASDECEYPKGSARRRSIPADPLRLYHPQYFAHDDCGAETDHWEDDALEEEEMPEDLADLEPREQQRRIKFRALWKMAFGSALVLIFSDPAVDAMAELGKRLHISPFYVSFVLAPVASNATELVAAYNYASKRTTKAMTTSLSTLLGAGVMNNTFCLGIFLGLVHFKNLAWEFSAETISILFVEAVVAVLVWGRKSMPLCYACIVLALYPTSLYMVWALENLAGLD